LDLDYTPPVNNEKPVVKEKISKSKHEQYKNSSLIISKDDIDDAMVEKSHNNTIEALKKFKEQLKSFDIII